MFTIDLLKGENLPIRTKPQGVAIFVATFAVPALVVMLMGGLYARNEVVISVQKQNVTNFDMQTKRLAEALKVKETYEKEKTSVNNCLADVAGSIHRHIQWSPILLALVESLPESVVVTNLEIKKQQVKHKVAVKGDTKKADANITVRILKMRVSGEPTSYCDLEVKAFRDRLRASSFLGSKLEDIVIASQGHDNLDGRDVVTYDIDFIFKPGV
jgi:Tfp pilus assembly protein PilN